MKNVLLALGILIITASTLFSQGAAINTGGNPPDPSAALDVSSTNQGVLIPRLTTAQRNAILNPAEGLQIYNLDCRNFNYNAGTPSSPEWVSLNQYIPLSPSAAVHSPSTDEILWNWTAVQGVTGYKYNTVNDYSTAIDNGASTSFLQTGLASCNTIYTLYVWSYTPCAESQLVILNESTLWCCGSNYIDTRNSITYPTVQIGTQCWMAKDLNYDPGNGTSWCYNNNASNCTTYGRLYTWATAMQSSTTPGAQGVCPSGWHIPTDQEWYTLESFVDPTILPNTTGWRGVDAGTKLKQGGSSGFNLLLGGFYRSGFVNINQYNPCWTSTEFSVSNAYERGPGVSDAGFYRANSSKGDGFHIRCIKD